MNSLEYYMAHIDESSKIQIDLDTRNAKEVRRVIEFLEQNSGRYGQVDGELLQYGRLYLKTDSREQRIAFLEDIFGRVESSPLARVQNIDYLATQCHVPEQMGRGEINTPFLPVVLYIGCQNFAYR